MSSLIVAWLNWIETNQIHWLKPQAGTWKLQHYNLQYLQLRMQSMCDWYIDWIWLWVCLPVKQDGFVVECPRGRGGPASCAHCLPGGLPLRLDQGNMQPGLGLTTGRSKASNRWQYYSWCLHWEETLQNGFPPFLVSPCTHTCLAVLHGPLLSASSVFRIACLWLAGWGEQRGI